uniref:Uncharacterized protein n=1 Tax=Brassica oleracea TaxID=3712 RepID=A0A3P6GM95_BRAOL|nr:unnamed protein product [Brassica oleracea]
MVWSQELQSCWRRKTTKLLGSLDKLVTIFTSLEPEWAPIPN